MIDYEIDLINLILEDIKPKNEEQERIKLYLETHKGNCEEYIQKSSKYKERIICLTALCLTALYHSLKTDLLSEIYGLLYAK